ncbi:MAG TPA: RIP metalloprotease RseP [Bacillota bacterium]|jgi:regulator of sigma E protease|nr:RIP metalloprotease RseP [Bacillota bacterium]HQJ38227.1 RIP metalloprotease RseP [Bacillota bacterium]HQL35654.1 RIP metalloprotease RseP [Bacillota bacterium]
MTVIAAILVFNLIVFVHEAGHFAAARLGGIKVVEFALGMGPKIISKKFGETVYSLRAFPVGGFCLMLGEDEENNDPGAFNNSPMVSKISSVASGPVFNIILTILIYSLVIAPVTAPIIGQVTKGMPAETAGIKAGEKVVSINDVKINEWKEMKPEIAKHEGEQITVTLEKNGVQREVRLTPVKNPNTEDIVIGVTQKVGISGFSIKEGIDTTVNVSKMMLSFLGQLVVGKADTDEVSGPISIIVYMNEAAKTGFISVLYLTALISLNLGILNLLPLPALDGGRLLFLLIELIRRKPLPAEKEGMVHFVGLVALMALSIFLMYKDIIKFNLIDIFR